MRELGQLIRTARKEKGLTLAKLGVLAGVAYPTVRDIERRNKMARKETLEKILAVLNMDIALVPLNTCDHEEPPSADTAAG